ncbi:MAG: ATP-binding protein [Deltaproteobacteria bacterium]|nr:ATP-binding protein [Deltaproteobacteria bacterium]
MNGEISSAPNLRFLLSEQAERFKRMDRGFPREALEEVKPYLKSPAIVVITGLRRSGKSTLQAQLADVCFPNDYYYLNFDDERWTGFEAAGFSRVHEMLIELFGEKKYFLMDEVQNIPHWELFVRRLHDAGHKIIITGSNASLLSREIGSHLTGRHREVELFPFSFREYLGFKGVEPIAQNTTQSAYLKRGLHDYLKTGGIPDALKYPEDDFCAQLYQDIIYRDISARYSIDSLKNLKELSLYLAGNAGKPVSFNKLRQMLMLGSVNTVKTYIDYLETSWLYFIINTYSTSMKQQQIAPKKVYCIDNGIINQVAFRSSDDTGWLLENVVFLHLRKKTSEIFYAKNDDGSEIDFLIRKGPKPVHLIQVSASLAAEETRKREVNSLLTGMRRYKINEATIVTLEEEETIRDKNSYIRIVPATKWLTDPKVT